MKEIHVLPFFVSEKNRKIDNDVIDLLKNDSIIIRGIEVCKKRLNSNIEIYKDDELIENCVYYWQPMFQEDDFIEKGLKLIKKGLGFD